LRGEQMWPYKRSAMRIAEARCSRGVALIASAIACASCAPPEAGVVEISAAAITITGTSATNDDSTVTYAISYVGSHSFFRVYLDADQRTATGFAVGGVGAEILIENGFRYRYTGTGTSWSWAQAGTVAFSNDGAVASWRIARADLGEVAPCTEAADLVFD